MLSVVLYGIAIVYLVGVVPAMVACAIRGQWAFLFAGFLALGLVWWIGLIGGTSRRHRVVALPVLLCAVLLIGDIGARPAQFVGVDGHALQGSVGGHWLTQADACRHLSGPEWSCERWSNQASGDISYRVHVSPLGCWRGVQTERWGGDPFRIAGCVHIDDFL